MEQSKLYAFEARCTQETMPHCQARCPLHMDVRAFLGHMGTSAFASARKVLERHLPLPEIMARICDHPCETPCLRRDLGGSVSIGALETLCIQKTTKQTKAFPRPAKGKRVAVLGAGLAGLVVAFELSKKAWPVTVYYTKNKNAHLLQHFSQLTEDIIALELDALQKQHCVFEERELSDALLQQSLEDFAAVFVDAHAAQDIFLSLQGVPDAAIGIIHGKMDDKLCVGGMPEVSPTGEVYALASAQAGQGRRAALTLERMLMHVSLTAERQNESITHSILHTDIAGVEMCAAVMPQGARWTEDEAAQEAKRCLHCDCMLCVKNCVYMQKYGAYPKRYARQIYNNAAIIKGEHTANDLINGCTLCGQCTELCPERFSMAELCLMARRDMVERAYMPPSAHEFALEDMESAMESALFLPDTRTKTQKYAFFPGCQLEASRSEQVLAVYDFARSKLSVTEGMGLILSCCGVPAHWAGQESLFHERQQYMLTQWENMGKPTLIMACASCIKTFRDFAPHVPLISLWEWLDTHITDIKPDMSIQKDLCIHDPCSARHDTAWQDAVRHLVSRCGISFTEPVNTREHTACCGYGGLVWCAQEDLAKHIATRLGENLGNNTALASCIMCRDRLVSSGKDCLHLLDILPFLQTSATCMPTAQSAPPLGLSARRAQRILLRQKASTLYGEEAVIVPPALQAKSLCALDIAPELLIKLEAKHILVQDVEEAVYRVEEQGSRFLEQQSGHYVGSWRPRNVTYWVRYTIVSKGQYILHDAWCHRMYLPQQGKRNEGGLCS